MSGFIAFMGYVTIVLCGLGGAFICFTAPRELLPLGVELLFGGIVSGGFLLGFSELLTRVRAINETLVDEVREQKMSWIQTQYGGSTRFDFILSRTKGLWGATFSLEGDDLQMINQIYSTEKKVMAALFIGAKTRLSAKSGKETSPAGQ